VEGIECFVHVTTPVAAHLGTFHRSQPTKWQMKSCRSQPNKYFVFNNGGVAQVARATVS
jgi:hypothetical protein